MMKNTLFIRAILNCDKVKQYLGDKSRYSIEYYVSIYRMKLRITLYVIIFIVIKCSLCHRILELIVVVYN